MKKSAKWILGVFVLLNFSTSSFGEETIRITNGEWAPYLSKNLKYYGVVSRIVSDAFALEGVKVHYEFFPWGRALDLAQHGEWDGSIIWFNNAERAKLFIYSEPVINGKSVFFHLKSFPFEWETMGDIKKKLSIGHLVGGFAGKEIDLAEKAGKIYVERAPTNEINFKKLLNKRVDLIVMVIDVGYNLLQDKFKSELHLVTHHPKPLNEKPMYLILSKKVESNKHRVKQFNKGLIRLKESGKYEQYFKESRRGEYIIKK